MLLKAHGLFYSNRYLPPQKKVLRSLLSAHLPFKKDLKNFKKKENDMD